MDMFEPVPPEPVSRPETGPSEGRVPDLTSRVRGMLLAHTLGTPPSVCRILAKGHELRNRREHEGAGQVDPRVVDVILAAGGPLLDDLRHLGGVR